MSTSTAIVAATAALVKAPLAPAAIVAAAKELVASVVAARAGARRLTGEALYYEGEGLAEHLGAQDYTLTLAAAVSAANVALADRATEVGRIADGACEHRDQLFPGAVSEEQLSEAWTQAHAWVQAVADLRDAAAALSDASEGLHPLEAMHAEMRRKHYVDVLRIAQDTIAPLNEGVAEAIDACITGVSASLYTGWHEENEYGVRVTRGSVAILRGHPKVGEVVDLAEEALRRILVEWLGGE